MHACDRRPDGQNYDSQDRPRICSRGKNHFDSTVRLKRKRSIITDTDIFTPHSFGTTSPNCQCSTTPHKAMCNTLTCRKTVEDPCCPVNVLLAIAIRCFNVFHYLRVYKFCVKFGNSIQNLVIWFSGKPLKLLPPDVRFDLHQIQFQAGGPAFPQPLVGFNGAYF